MVPLYRFFMAAALLVALCAAAAAGPGIETYFGDDVALAGYSTGGPFVYLFLTGPNLPENGVALNDITRRADQGYFTKISVDGADRWTYTWHTGSLNGRLDAGTYTIWVVDQPLDRSRLSYADFSTIGVTIIKPYVSVETPAPPGAIDVQSVPAGASVTVNGVERGIAPLTLRDLPAGTYTVNLSLSGFTGMSVQVNVEQGRTSEVLATLGPETGTLALNSTPSGARVTVDGTDRGTTPVTIPGLSPGNHTVMLQREGYTTVAREIAITAGRTSPVEIDLALPATVSPTARSAPTGLAVTGALVLVFLGISRIRRQ